MRGIARAILSVCVVIIAGLWGQRVAAQTTSPPSSQWHHSVWSFEGAPFVTSAQRMLRSADGYLWIGAGRAMVRFDGARFTVFDSTNTPAFRFGAANALMPAFLDRDGVMWVSGEDRALFTYRNGHFARVTADDAGAGARRRPYINPMAVMDGAGRVWWCDRTVVMMDGGRPSRALLPASMPDTGIVQIARDTGSGMWFGTYTDGLWHLTPSGVEHFPFTEGAIRPMLQSGDGSVWAASAGRNPRLWRLKDGRFERMAPKGDETLTVLLQDVLEAPDHSVWFGTHGMGVLRWRDGEFERLDEAQGLSSAKVHALWIGPDGTVWLTTDTGLERLRAPAFMSLDRKSGLPFGSAGQFALDVNGGLWSVSPASESLYFIDGGLMRQKNERVSHVRFLPNNGEVYKLLGAAKDGGVWIGPNTGGLIRQRKTGAEQLPSSVGLPIARILQAIQTPDGAVWTKAFTREVGRVRNGQYRRVHPFGTDSIDTWGMLADGLGRIWFANGAGNELAALADDSVVVRIKLPPAARPFDNFTWEGGDTLWFFSTHSLRRVIGQNISEVPVVDAKSYLLPDSEIEVGAGQLWLAARTGIVRFSLAQLHAAADTHRDTVQGSLITSLDGIAKPQAPSRNDNAIIRLPDNRAWFATPGGYAVTNTSYRYEDAVVPTAHVEEVTVDGKLVPGDSNLSIPPTPDRVAIHYTATSLSLPERVHIEYMLEGADRAWVEGSASPRVATYTQLRPGWYRFRVRTLNANGSANNGEAVLQFHVLRAWYQSFWFYALCTALLTALGYFVALAMQRDRNRRSTERAEARFKAVLDERIRIARELHDTLLQGFTGITLHLETVRGQLAHRADASANDLDTILQHADSVLREAREMVWDIRSPELDGGLMHAIETESRKVLNSDHVALRLSVTGTARRLTPATETTILRVARESVTNALKHADPKSIDITLAYDTHHIGLTVRDDGRGAEPSRIEQARNNGHWGLAGMRERATRAGGTFEVHTAPSAGLSVTICLPAEPV